MKALIIIIVVNVLLALGLNQANLSFGTSLAIQLGVSTVIAIGLALKGYSVRDW